MNHWAKIIGAVETHGTCALVTITNAEGSTPREEGAWIEGQVYSGQMVIADVRILLVAMDGLDDGKKKIVFNDKLLAHYDVFAVASRS